MIEVTSEIGTLKKVLLHRPGKELERLAPQFLEQMLFEDIPWLDQVQREHDGFAQTLGDYGCQLFYYRDLLEEVFTNPQARSLMTDRVISASLLGSQKKKESLRDFLDALTPEDFTEVMISGLGKRELAPLKGEGSLSRYIQDAQPFYIHPLTNLYFTRDPGAVIAKGLCINAMKSPARVRETWLLEMIYRYHNLFALSETETPVTSWYKPEDLDSIEGGDILVLSKKSLLVGCSARTGVEGIERLAKRILASRGSFEEVLVLQIPFARAYMHLDTVLTMVDKDAFLIFPGIRKEIALFRLTLGSAGELHIKKLDNLEAALADALDLPRVRLIESGGGDPVTAAREQWNDSTNTLALAPGVVVCYNRNSASNKTLREAGITVVEIEGSELVRGRGGPRCMSMPLERAPV